MASKFVSLSTVLVALGLVLAAVEAEQKWKPTKRIYHDHDYPCTHVPLNEAEKCHACCLEAGFLGHKIAQSKCNCNRRLEMRHCSKTSETEEQCQVCCKENGFRTNKMVASGCGCADPRGYM